MKFARAVALALLVATPLAIFVWLKREPAGDAATSGGTRGDAAQEAANEAGAKPPPFAPPAPAPTRVPVAAEPAANGMWKLELDLRGPGDARLGSGRVHAHRDAAIAAKPAANDDVELSWRRDTPAIEVAAAAATLLAEAESDPAPDAIPCGDLVSDPTPIDPKAPPPSPLVIRLHARPGIYGRLLGVEVDPHDRVRARHRFGVNWQALVGGRSIAAAELQLTGRAATVVELAGGGIAYFVHDLAPGRYALAGRSNPGGPFETPCEVEVADAMVRRDLTLDAIDPATMLHVVVQGLAPEELARVSFLWIVSPGEVGGGDAMVARTDAPGSFWVAPLRHEATFVFKWFLDGVAVSDVKASLALLRDGTLAAAQPVTSGQHEVTFACGADARLRVRCDGPAEEVARLRVVLVPAAAPTLLEGPETMLGGSSPLATGVEVAFEHLVPGDFFASIWGQVHSDLNHADVWWPLERRALALHGGDQELALVVPPLHPVTIRCDLARFGKDARVRLVRRDFGRWPVFALPDATGVANFAALPDGDYTVTVIGDMAGEQDFTLPGTSELRVEPTRREDH